MYAKFEKTCLTASLIIIISFSFLNYVYAYPQISKKEIINYLDYNLNNYEQIGLFNLNFLLATYYILEMEVPNRTQIIDFLNSLQSNEGTWATGQNHYVPITAEVLMFYNRSGVEPAKSLEPFFSTIDTWEKVNAHVNTYDSTNYWGGLWGYITSYVVYRGEAPPWIEEFLKEVNDNFDTWAYSNHQRTHVILSLFQLGAPVPRVDEVVNITLQQQKEDGSWDHDLTETSFMIGAFDLMRKQTNIDQMWIDSTISKGLNFINSCYKRFENEGGIYAGFATIPSEQYPNPWATALGVYSLLNPESDVWTRWVIPEFPSNITLLLFMMIISFGIVFAKKRLQINRKDTFAFYRM